MSNVIQAEIAHVTLYIPTFIHTYIHVYIFFCLFLSLLHLDYNRKSCKSCVKLLNAVFYLLCLVTSFLVLSFLLNLDLHSLGRVRGGLLGIPHVEEQVEEGGSDGLRNAKQKTGEPSKRHSQSRGGRGDEQVVPHSQKCW